MIDMIETFLKAAGKTFVICLIILALMLIFS